ncbi:hypothetical protein D3C80_1571750 [compost metagenome]
MRVPVHERVVVLLGGKEAPPNSTVIRQRARDVSFCAVVVPRANACLNVRFEFACWTLADHVDHGTGVTCPRHQAGCATDDFDTVVQPHVHKRTGHVTRLVILIGRHTIKLIDIDSATARINVEAFAPILRHGDARGLGQDLVHAAQMLVVHALTRNHCNGLGRFANRKVHLGGRAGNSRCVGARSFRGFAQPGTVHIGR